MKNVFVSVLAFLCLAVNAQTKKDIQLTNYPTLIVEQSKSKRNQAQELFTKHYQTTPENRLVQTESATDNLGFVHDKYQQYYKNIKVDGGLITVHSRNDVVESLSGDFKGLKGIQTVPTITEVQALQVAYDYVKASKYNFKPKGELVIVGPHLAWKFDMFAADILYRAFVYVDAHSGRVVQERNQIHTSDKPAKGVSLYDGVVSFIASDTGTNLRLRQRTSGGGIETYTLNNTTNYSLAKDIISSSDTFSTDQAANQAHYGAERTYDYYKTKHNRNSFDNLGSIIKSYTHYSVNYVNAFWNGSYMTYGDGNSNYKPLVSLDICGHEITHGVTTYSANLVYSGEPGALNESFSDIFGEVIENYARGTNDWLMGCDIGVNGCGAFRSFINPNAYTDPDTYKGTYWYSGTGDNGGVHTNSGVQNKWFYILTVGESGTNDIGTTYNVAGIGMDKAAAIAYRNLTVYLSTSSDYFAARVGSIQAAKDLYGDGSPEVIATANAWYAVGVGCAYNQTCVVPYCASQGNSQADEWIGEVKIDTFINTTGPSPYTYFANKQIRLRAGDTLPIRLTPVFKATRFAEYWRVWIDFNGDRDFTDASELVYDSQFATDTVRNGRIIIPAGAKDSTVMRVTMKYANPPSPCETFTWGEVEDYPVKFIQPAPIKDTIPPSTPVLSALGITTTDVTFSWTKSVDNASDVFYNLYINDTKSLDFDLMDTFLIVPGFEPNTTYTAYVIAKDSGNNIAKSNVITFTTQYSPDLEPPTAPDLKPAEVTTTAVKLTWGKSIDNRSSVIYEVYVNDAYKTTLTDTSYTVSSLNSNTAYTAYIIAKDSSGNLSKSSIISFTTLIIPDTEPPTISTLSSPSKTAVSVNLSWTRAVDNRSSVTYDVYTNGVYKTSTIDTFYTVASLTGNTSYDFYVIAKDTSGNMSMSNILTVTTLVPITETSVAGYYFNTNLDSWVPSSTANCQRTTTNAWEGTGAMLLQGKNTTATSPTLALSGYSQVEIKFYFKVVNMKAGEKFTLSYSANNKTYTTLATYAYGTAFQLNTFYVSTITTNNIPYSNLRFTVMGSDVNDKVYIDAITVKGRTGTTGSSTIISTTMVSGFTEVLGSVNVNRTQQFRYYPNPVEDVLIFSSQIQSAQIFSTEGKVVKTITSTTNRIDVSDLTAGVYFATVFVDGERFKIKLIKK